MLKIKDNVDLKELEKFGFEEIKNRVLPKNSFYSTEKKAEENGQICMRLETRNLFEIGSLDMKTVDTLYDLIKADLVERV